MISTKQIIPIVILTCILGCSPSDSAINFPFFQSQTDISKDTLIIPGKRVGAVTAKTTHADLVKIFGESKLQDEILSENDETISIPITKVNLGGENYFTIAWEDDSRQKLLYLSDFGSAWKIPEDIGVGTSFQELRQKLGEFKLTGLGWNYGGFINLETTKLSEYQGFISLKVSPNEKAIEKYPQQYEAVLTDQELSANNPNWKALDMKVSQISILFDE